MSSSQLRALSLPKTVMLNLYQDDYLLGSIQDLSLGEKSRVGEGDELPRKVRGIHPPGTLLRDNFEKCYSVCTDLVASG